MRFKKYLTEKLQPSQFRKLIKAWKETGADKIFDHIFGDKHRLYFEYKGKIETGKEKSIEFQISRALETLNTFFNTKYAIKDYKKGLAYNKQNKKEIKIVKMLDGLIKRCKEKKESPDISNVRSIGWQDQINILEYLKKEFINDKSRELQKSSSKYLICISRHAYDIAGMSTDRGWNSCMTLPGDKKNPEGGCNYHLVTKEINEGCLIAYLIKADDKNLQHPIGRVMIKPYYHVTDYGIMWVVGDSGYGTTPREFLDQVEDWVESKLNGDNDGGLYSLSPEVESSDFPDVKMGKNTMKIVNWKDLLDNYEAFNMTERFDYDASYAIAHDYIFDLDDIVDDLEGIAGKKIVKDLISLAEKDEWAADDFVENLIRYFSNKHEYDVLSPFKAVGLAIKVIKKDFERENWNETYLWILDTIKKRNLLKYGDTYFLPRSNEEMAEMLNYIKPYLDRLYEVYG